MSSEATAVQAMIDEMQLTMDELCRLAGVGAPWLQQRVELGLLRVDGPPEAWRFDAAALRRVSWMFRLERDFDAVPELAALVVDLQEEIASLRAQLSRLSR